MQTILRDLENVGLSGKAAKIYLALLELGEGSVIDIARKTQLKRTSVYNILPDLIQEGLVKTTIHHKRRMFFIQDVRQLGRSLEEKQLLLRGIIPELRAMHTVIPHKPKITFYDGEGGAKDFFQDTLECVPPGGIIRELIGPQAFYDLLPKGFAATYIPERVQRKIQIRIIASPSSVAKKMHTRDRSELREMRFINGLNFDFYAGMELYANKVAFISFRENFMGVIIESPDIYAMQAAAFDVMWNALKE